MSPPRFFTDEDIHAAVVPALRRAGFDALSTPEVSRRHQSDDSQLEWAAGQGRALVTFNAAHFAELHGRWLRAGRSHAGIIVSSQRPVGDTVRRLVHLASVLSAELMRDRLEFLGNW